MKIFELTPQQIEEFRDVQIVQRADWPATFSCNTDGEVWPFHGYGHTYAEHRMYLQGEITLLDEIVETAGS